ncbi:MAG TPA: PBP1A family penicillin-binding protein [Armatimonadota bacterium]
MRDEMRQAREMRRRKRWYRFFRGVTLCVLLAVGFGFGFVGGLFSSVSQVLPSNEELSDIRPAAPTRILACDGSLLAKVYSENREIIAINRMSYMPLATLAIEDIRFNEHPGIDLHGIARAMVRNFIAGNSKEGASTITQQLARNIYLTREKKLTRKLQEVVLALQLERRYSKQEILETYLNQVYYGANRYSVQSWGVQMAAKNYFAKDASKLTLSECALLAGLPKNPRDYNPFRFPDAARRRRDTVLSSMLENSCISKAQYQEAVDAPLRLAPEHKIQVMADFHAPYFVRQILATELPKIFGQDTHDLTYDYGVDVYTTIDPRMQKKAEEVVTEQVQANHFRNIDDGALVAIDPKTGFIKAMVGGTNFRKDQYNIITQGHRQPGSAFKPFVYTTALLHGYTPQTRVYDRPGHYPSGSGAFWSPKNSDNRYRGAMQLQQALWQSRNAVAAGVANDVGINTIIKVAYSMGIKYSLEPYLSTALGASVVVPLEICSGYGTLANGGVHNPPVAIERVTTHDGEVLYEYTPQPQRILPTSIANTMKTMMRGVVERGTGRAARCPFPASGKTGTTNSFHDAWFIGYTDDLVAAVWVGNRQNQPMNHTFGGTVPAPIWRQFMLVAHPIMAVEHKKNLAELVKLNDLPEPTNVDMQPTPYIIKHGNTRARSADPFDVQATVPAPVTARDRYVVTLCQQTHLRATPACPDTVAVTYVRGRAPYPPNRSCNVHRNEAATTGTGVGAHLRHMLKHEDSSIQVSVCAETGKLATSKCPQIMRKRFAPGDAPTETCPLHRD